MELLKYLNENLIHIAYKDENLNAIKIYFGLINKDNSKNVKNFDDYLKLNETILDSNTDNLLKLAEKSSKQNIRGIIEKTIDEINNKFILYLINTDGLDCDDINQIHYVIRSINNSL